MWKAGNQEPEDLIADPPHLSLVIRTAGYYDSALQFTGMEADRALVCGQSRIIGSISDGGEEKLHRFGILPCAV